MRPEGQHHALAAVVEPFLAIGVVQYRQHAAIHARRGLDHERHRPALGAALGPVGVLNGQPGVGILVLRHGCVDAEFGLVLGVGAEVEIGAVGDAFEFFEAVGKAVHHVHRRLGVVRQFLGRHFVEAQVVLVDPLLAPPCQALGHPALVPCLVAAWGHEELQLHLLELAHPEDEVARRDLVAERLADLRDAERQAGGGGIQHVLEVGEDRLRGLWPQVGERSAVFHRADVGLEHQIEGARGREVARAAARTGAVAEVVGAPARFALAAIHQRVGEGFLVARIAQHLRVGEDGRVQAFHVVAFMHHRPPPRGLQVVLQLHAERAVVVHALQAAVDFAGLEYEAAPLAQRNQFVHG